MRFLALLFCALAALRAPQQEFQGRVVAVHDGDTITVLRGRTDIRVRLAAIDAPELRQAFGRSAKRRTAALVFGRTVLVRPNGLDPYGRLVAHVLVDGHDLSVILVRHGLAWHFTRYSDDTLLARAQQAARTARRGLWSEEDPLAPWIFRSASRRGQDDQF